MHACIPTRMPACVPICMHPYMHAHTTQQVQVRHLGRKGRDAVGPRELIDHNRQIGKHVIEGEEGLGDRA